MDHILTSKIYNFLQLKTPTDAQIVEGATLMLQLSPNRNRSLYNSAMQRPKTYLPWVRAELKKFYDIRKRGLKTEDVEPFQKETVALVTQTLSTRPATIEMPVDEEPLIPVLGIRGRREDHDELPESIQAIWERNAERWKKMRKLHTQLAQMIAKPDYAPCDGNELCYLLRQADTDLRNDYEIYDTYIIYEKTDAPQDGEPVSDNVDVFTDNVKTVQAARTAITRGLKLESPTEKQLQKLQDAVNTLWSLKQVVKPETVERLKEFGISIPEDKTSDDNTDA